MNIEEFYLSLASNSSFGYYPDNKTSKFSTKLPKSISLLGNWVVGLSEIFVPCTINNINGFDNYIKIDHKDKSKSFFRIPDGYYDNLKAVISILNEILADLLTIEISTDNHDRVFIECINKSVESIFLPDKICLYLGFEPNTNFIKKHISKFTPNYNLSINDLMFIYTDIVEPSVVGDTLAPLLRITALEPYKYNFGSGYIQRVFNPVQYIPLAIREFETIDIDIRTAVGELMPFAYGTLCLKLHFKKTQ